MVGLLVTIRMISGSKNNLTEINHKVEVIAKGFRRAIAIAFAEKCVKCRSKAEESGVKNNLTEISHKVSVMTEGF
jgi:hypothetical protein